MAKKDENLEGADPQPPLPPLPPGNESEEIRLHPILSNERVLELRARAKEKIDAEDVKAAEDAFLKVEQHRLRMQVGLLNARHLDPIQRQDVTLTIDLPFDEFDGQGGMPSNSIRVNGTAEMGGAVYYHGQTYTVPRHIAHFLLEQMQHMKQHEAGVKGQSMAQRLNKARRDANLADMRGVPTVNAKTGSQSGRAPIPQAPTSAAHI